MWRHSRQYVFVYFLLYALKPVFGSHEFSPSSGHKEGSGYDSFLRRTTAELCLYSRFCTQGPALQIDESDKSPCCSECSCEEDCVRRGTCCPDFDHQHPDTKSKQDKIQTDECLWTAAWPLVRQQFYTKFKSYYTVSTCPRSFKQAEVIDRCENPKFSEPWENVRVSDDRNVVYKNKHCAMCNGIARPTPWRMEISCAFLSVHSILQLDFNELKHYRCIVNSVPPLKQHLLAESICRYGSRSVCNETGFWAKYDENVEKACSEFNFPYRISMSQSTSTATAGLIYYKNPYCYMCNVADVNDIPELCPVDATDNMPTKFGSFSFTALMDENTAASSMRIEERAVCTKEDIYDPHFEVCRKLLCPIPMVPIFGQCHVLLREVKNLDISVVLELTHTDERQSKDPKQYSDAVYDQLQAQASAELMFDVGNCLQCSAITMVSDNGEILLLLTATANPTCTMRYIYNRFKQLHDTHAQYKVVMDGHDVTFRRQISYKFASILDFSMSSESRDLKYFMPGRDPLRHICEDSYLLRAKFYCNSLDVFADEYKMLIESRSAGSMFDSSDFTKVTTITEGDGGDNANETRYRICTDVYIPKPSHGNSSGKITFSLGMLILHALLSTL